MNNNQSLLKNNPLDKNKTIAFIPSPQLGDALISMVTVNNLRRNSYNIHVFSNYLAQIDEWFPTEIIYKKPSVNDAKEILRRYDYLVYTYRSDLIANDNDWHNNIIFLADSPLYKAPMSLVDIQVALCEKELLLSNLTRENNLIPPASCLKNRYPNRIVIHPTSREKRRSWQEKKFVKLAFLLQQQGYQVSFITSPSEHANWEWVLSKNIQLPKFNNLADTAKWVYESSFFIGNDSGIGHLASNLGLPTISLILRPNLARQWRPAWSPGLVVLPRKILITRYLRERFWRYFVSVNRVFKLATNFFILPTKLNPKYICYKSFYKRMICDKEYYTDEIRALLTNPDKFINDENTTLLKNDKTSVIALMNINEHKLIIKKYHTRKFLKIIISSFADNRVSNSIANGLLLARIGFNTPKPIATIQNKFGPIHLDSYLITEYVDGINGFKYFADEKISLEHKKIIIEKIAGIAHDFARNMITHGDLQFGNMLVCGDEVFIIDLDRMHLHKSKNWFYKNKRLRDIRVLLEHPKENQQLREMMYKALFSKTQ